MAVIRHEREPLDPRDGIQVSTGQEQPTRLYNNRSPGDPYYPIPRSENTDYTGIPDAGRGDERGDFVGRLATYKYYTGSVSRRR